MNDDNQSADRRVLRTRRALRDAMISLLVEQGWDDINIQDLCDRADVGRSTFYMHFQNKEELLVSGLNDLRGALQAQATSSRQRAAGAMPFVRGLIEHVYEQRMLFKSIIGRRSGHVVQKRFREMVTQLVDDDVSRLASASWQRDAGAHYLAGALAGLLSWWMDAGNALSADDIESHFHRLTLPVIKQLGGKN